MGKLRHKDNFPRSLSYQVMGVETQVEIRLTAELLLALC